MDPEPPPATAPIPRHVGIIMDGNGRWARRRNRPHSFGHRAGVRAMKRVMYACEDIGIHVLSVYVFSTENWSRPAPEVRALMRLFHESIQREIDELDARGIRIVVSGRRSDLSPLMRRRIQEAEQRSAGNRRGVLNVCLNYGGRAELVDAIRGLVEAGPPPAAIDESALARRLYHPELPDPDLIIRTAGERRLSNFLLWQSAYSEIYFTDTLWPDFDAEDLQRAVADYQTRVRRFGGRPDLPFTAVAT
ncbi:MAG: polyprenyl diphosphate synthase [Candidatus Dormibacteraeota bacterium]|nr:polyprenyl diphosphate synthase [Candidatus Dormibacteraeota bacterium]